MRVQLQRQPEQRVKTAKSYLCTGGLVPLRGSKLVPLESFHWNMNKFLKTLCLFVAQSVPHACLLLCLLHMNGGEYGVDVRSIHLTCDVLNPCWSQLSATMQPSVLHTDLSDSSARSLTGHHLTDPPLTTFRQVSFSGFGNVTLWSGGQNQ